MFPCIKWILGSAIVALFSLTAGPVLAGSDVLFTGGGIITDGSGAAAKRIPFSVGLFVDADGMTDGRLQFHFHNLDDVYALDQSRFTASVFDSVLIETRYRDTVPFTFVRIEARGSLDRMEGWSVLVRFSDFGVPVNNKEMLPENADALRISLFGPGGEAVYDTALDYPREQAWRTLLDGGNVSVDMRLAPDP
ncbi:MAG: hypothetical protein JSW21_08445 [Gammaproteobacteria bacterium]|nr:MAG: hypothetical protein JSW21_08445 [Gammaproteobacteria bacterium]